MARRKGTGVYTKTYMTKNGPVTKTYMRGQVNVLTKTGKISKPFLKRVAGQLGVEPTRAEMMDLEATARRLAKTYTKRELPVNLLTPQMVVASYKHDRIEGMLVNTGFTLEQIAEQANTTVQDLTTESNWAFSKVTVFTNSKGESYLFTFQYNGSVMERL